MFPIVRFGALTLTEDNHISSRNCHLNGKMISHVCQLSRTCTITFFDLVLLSLQCCQIRLRLLGCLAMIVLCPHLRNALQKLSPLLGEANLVSDICVAVQAHSVDNRFCQLWGYHNLARNLFRRHCCLSPYNTGR